jgi:hypothetical protein
MVRIVTIGLWRVNDADFTVYCCWLWAQVSEVMTCICCVMITEVISITHFLAEYLCYRIPPTHPHTPTGSRPCSAPVMLASLLRYLAVRSLFVSCALAGVWRSCVCVCSSLQCQHRCRPCDTLIYTPVIVQITAGVLRPSLWWYGRRIHTFVISFGIMSVLRSSKYIITPLTCWKIACVVQINEKYTFRAVYV